MQIKTKNMVNVYNQLVILNKNLYLKDNEAIRLAGYLEACLQNKGVIEVGAKDCFVYETKPWKFLFWKGETKEHYTQVIARMCKEYFDKEEINIED